MRENGTIRYKTLYENTPIDSNGDPVAASAYWSAAIPCLVRTITDTRKAKYEDGEYHAMSFEILVEGNESTLGLFNHILEFKQSLWVERKGESMGDFQIISVEELPTVGRIRIIV